MRAACPVRFFAVGGGYTFAALLPTVALWLNWEYSVESVITSKDPSAVTSREGGEFYI